MKQSSLVDNFYLHRAVSNSKHLAAGSARINHAEPIPRKQKGHRKTHIRK
ncbi:hypothetical protein SynBIOSE41_00252 [Synechococcus sp. BIOS-E4-1]|nr:hypothetical protein SynBIOSE41_00252 [Synechococcus sp. BIOS-E4-1]